MSVRECLGNQRATTRLMPRGNGDETSVHIARTLGYDLLPWQEEILTGSAVAAPGGMWKTFENVVIAPRQQGKSFLVIPRVLAGALVFDERLIVYSAHEQRTARETWLMMMEACEHEAIRPYVRNIWRRGAFETVEFTNGARFKLAARGKSSLRGFSPDCVILDEAFSVDGDVMASVLPAVSARRNPQVFYLSSAGTWQSTVLLGLRKRGHAKASNRLGYWEWHASPGDDFRDEKVWRCANPSYGILQTRESIERELESLSPRTFGRERLGIWTESFAENALSEEDIHAITIDVPQAPRDGRAISWGVDVAGDRSAATICAAFNSDAGLPTVVLVETRPGAGWVAERLSELQNTYPGAVFAYDGRGGMTDIMDRAERDFQIERVGMKYSEYPAACAGFAQSVADRRLRIGRAPDLVMDATHAVAKMLTSGWVWDRNVATPPIRLVAATAALWLHERETGASRVAVY